MIGQVFLADNHIIAKCERWYGTRWYVWSQAYNNWMAAEDMNALMAVMEGAKAVREMLADLVQRKGHEIGKLEFLVLTGHKLM